METVVRVRVFKWNRALPENVVPPGTCLLMIRIRNDLVPVFTTINGLPAPCTLQSIFRPFVFFVDLQDFSSGERLQKMIFDKLVEAYLGMLNDEKIRLYVAMIYYKLVGSYVFNIENLSCAGHKTVVVLEVIDFSTKLGAAFLDKSTVVARLMEFVNLDPPVNPWNYNGLGLIHPLSMFELVRVDQEPKSTDEEDVCAICLDGLSLVGRRGVCRKMMTCSHVFHGDCIGRWLWMNSSCPICRSRLPE